MPLPECAQHHRIRHVNRDAQAKRAVPLRAASSPPRQRALDCANQADGQSISNALMLWAEHRVASQLLEPAAVHPRTRHHDDGIPTGGHGLPASGRAAHREPLPAGLTRLKRVLGLVGQDERGNFAAAHPLPLVRQARSMPRLVVLKCRDQGRQPVPLHGYGLGARRGQRRWSDAVQDL